VFAAVLAASLSTSQGPLPAHEPLPRLTVSFVSINIKVRRTTLNPNESGVGVLPMECPVKLNLWACWWVVANPWCRVEYAI